MILGEECGKKHVTDSWLHTPGSQGRLLELVLLVPGLTVV